MVSSDLVVAASSYDEKAKERTARIRAVEDAIENLQPGDIFPEQIVVWKELLEGKVDKIMDYTV